MSDPETTDLKPEKRLLTFMLNKSVPPVPTDDERVPHPEKKSNIFKKITFWWLVPVMKVGYKRTLEPNDLFELTESLKVETMASEFYGHFEKHLQAAHVKHIKKKCAARGEKLGETAVDPQTDLEDFKMPWTMTTWCLFLTFKWQYTMSCVSLTISTLTNTLNPLLIRHLISFVQRRVMGLEPHVGKGIGYSFGTAILVLFAGITMNHCFYRSMLVGAKAKAVLTKALLDKSFRLSDKSRHQYPVGKITSMMGTDLSRIDFALGLQPFIITFPAPLIAAIVVLVINLGASALVGIGLMLAFILFMAMVTKRLVNFRKSANKYTDSRVNYIKELLNNLRIIKYYSWEQPYFNNISKVRNQEMNIIYLIQVFRNVITACSMTLTIFCAMSTFLVLYAVGGQNGAAAVFSSLTLFNVLTQQVFLLPMALAAGADALVAVTRVGEFMAAPEGADAAKEIMATDGTLEQMRANNVSVQLQNADFNWESFEDEEPKSTPNEKEAMITDNSSNSTLDASHFQGLRDLNLDIKKGEFVVITGLIGSGKSSLLSAIAGAMKRTRGSVDVDGSLILCGYPWIQNATVKENIFFGNDPDAKKYEDVIYACSLESDLEILPAGDRTEIGERGITLSGGQKARINLARAVYADKDIILLDDVLSAVDARVGKHIVEKCLMGLLKDKTRILATHQLSLIGDADRIIFLNGNGSISVGTYDELHRDNEGFRNLMTFNEVASSEEEDVLEKDEEELVAEVLDKQLSKTTTAKTTTESVEEDEEGKRRVYNQDKETDGKLILQESKNVNGITWRTYQRYLSNGSGIFNTFFIVCLVVFFLALATFCSIFTNVWLSFWVERKFDSLNNGQYIGLYVMFAFLALFFLAIAFVLVAYVCNRASMRLNVKSVRSVLYSPMSFLDTTPMGRILNRFTKDTDVMDNEIGEQSRFFFFSFSTLCGILILCVIYLPWFAIAVPALAGVFVAVGNFYSSSSRELKRLESVQRSFVYNNFNETLSGMSTIKAYKSEERFLNANATYLNNMNESYFLSIAAQRWLTICLTLIACAFSLLISLLCVNSVFSISPASTGLLLSYSLQITPMLSVLLRNYTQMENGMTSVERLCEFAFDLIQEARHIINETTPPPEWPTKGEIKFDKVSMAYRPGLPLVLKNLDFTVKSQEKIGICGRTGAGKSSIMSALYRLSELNDGKIFIDGLDISTLGLRDLRSKLSIIPQDPVLFKGNIRNNLDPFNQSSDEALWDALRRAGLIEDAQLESIKTQTKTTVAELHKFHLDQEVEDDGTNFSLGERQLIAFARALVRDSNILILDEATSSVDYETDSKIQKTITEEFSNYTILCIAHRLKTIINYDKILVLDRGEIKEFATPWELFNTENSIFQQMCQKSNIVADDFERK